MGRESYDDMTGPERSRRKGSRPATGIIALLGILICLVGLLCFLILNPSDNSVSETATQTPVSVEVKEPEIIIDEESEPADAEAETAAAAEVQVQSVTEIVTPSVAQDSVSSSSRPAALDLVRAQDLASFDTSDHVIYISHEVKEGESLESIASSYGRKIETIISVNRIRNLSAVTAGTVLQIPNMDGQLYTVQEGDMLSTIARKFNPDLGWQTLMVVNQLRSETIRVGQELFIPDLAADESQSIQIAEISFTFPADGTIYVSYGQFFNSSQLDGVLIGTDAGSAVCAAADGIVIDAGKSEDYGHFVVIQHDQGYKTTYANLETVEASIGSEVEQGQIIGAVGGGGEAFTRPTLYFMMEQNGILLNPAMFF